VAERGGTERGREGGRERGREASVFEKGLLYLFLRGLAKNTDRDQIGEIIPGCLNQLAFGFVHDWKRGEGERRDGAFVVGVLGTERYGNLMKLPP